MLVQGSAPHSGILDYFDMRRQGYKKKEVKLDGPGMLYVHVFSQLWLGWRQEKYEKMAGQLDGTHAKTRSKSTSLSFPF